MTAFLAERRRNAAERNAALPVPTIKDEHWRYTNLRGIDFGAFAPVASPVVLTAGSLPAGVLFMDLEQAAAEHPELIERHLGAIVGTDEKFAAENAALWTDGVLVYVPKGVQVDEPLKATFTIPEHGAAQQWRVLVIAEEGSRVAFMEEHAEGLPGYANGVAELHVGANANVEYVSFQHRHLETLHFASHRAEVARDAELDWVAVALGSKTGKSRMESRLTGPGSTAKLTGAYVLDGTQHVDLDTTQEHDAPNATSDLFFKGVLSESARSVWRGVIRVAKDAQKTDAYQENRNLVLSPKAHADSIPGLEIKANDVRCTHGATIGRVDPEALYYLMSRGLDRPAAERLIVEGFFVDAFARIRSPELREQVQKALLAKLP
ncbi:MAG: Fe-S cluster assembly protein SufD [Gaiellaceae bacterium]|nr:Fe-S cluster assembly protein SufD [Gaiellaceae bacterium]